MQRIVVGGDGSEASQAGLRWAVEEATPRHAAVEAVMAWHPSYVGATPFAPIPIDTGDIEAATKAELDRLVDALEADGLPAPVERVVVRGSAAGSLVEQAKGADLLVVGTRGHGGFAGLLLGSVSQQVAHHAPCPVVIVPSPEG